MFAVVYITVLFLKNDIAQLQIMLSPKICVPATITKAFNNTPNE